MYYLYTHNVLMIQLWRQNFESNRNLVNENHRFPASTQHPCPVGPQLPPPASVQKQFP